MPGTRQRPFSEDIATGTPDAGKVPVSAGPGTGPPAWGAVGGGGGGPIVIAHYLCTGTETAVVLAGVTDSYGSLVLEGRCRFSGAASANGADGRPLGLELNALGSAPTLHYVLTRSGWVSGAVFQSVQASSSWPLNIAIVPGSDTNTADWASLSHRFTVPRHVSVLDAGDDLFHHFHGKSFYTAGSNYLQIDHSGAWGVYPHEPINSLKLLAYEELATFEAGSEFTLWGYPAP